MPKLEQGDLESVAALKEMNIPRLRDSHARGYAIVAPVPSCTLMFSTGIPIHVPRRGGRAPRARRHVRSFRVPHGAPSDGLLKTEFPSPLGKVAYHVPCHSRVQKFGPRTRRRSKRSRAPRCHDRALLGTRGYLGREGGIPRHGAQDRRPIFRQVAESATDFFASDCQLAGHHIEQGLGSGRRQFRPATATAHPITLVRMAYGLSSTFQRP